jgi:hypothetical protein
MLLVPRHGMAWHGMAFFVANYLWAKKVTMARTDERVKMSIGG